MKDKTKNNLYKAFVGEAKAYFRLLAYSKKAKEEDLKEVALLFKAIAEAEKVHAIKNLELLKDIIVKDTDTNLKNSFDREKSISENEYPNFIKDAQDEGEKVASIVFGYARDAETFHAKLYERAIYNLLKDKVSQYNVCMVCGFVTEKKIPEKCPICGAPKDKFKTISEDEL